jgi:hypothetical protein
VGQVWRDGRVQVTLARLLRSEEIEIVPLDEQLARSCGELCGAASASHVIDASVVIVARERQDVIVTSDPGDLQRLDPAAQITPSRGGMWKHAGCPQIKCCIFVRTRIF